MTGLLRERGIFVVTAVCLALTASFPAIGQQTQVAEDCRAIRSETTGVMLDLDPANNVFAIGETISQVVTRKHAPDGPLLWERIAPTLPDRARAGWISTDPSGNAIVAAYRGPNRPPRPTLSRTGRLRTRREWRGRGRPRRHGGHGVETLES